MGGKIDFQKRYELICYWCGSKFIGDWWQYSRVNTKEFCSKKCWDEFHKEMIELFKVWSGKNDA